MSWIILLFKKKKLWRKNGKCLPLELKRFILRNDYHRESILNTSWIFLSLLWKKKRKLFLFRMGDASHVSIWIGFFKKEKNQIRSHTPGYPARLFNRRRSELRPAALNGQKKKKFLFVGRISDSTAASVHQLYSIPIWQKPKGPGWALCCRLETNGPTRIFQLCICSDSSFFLVPVGTMFPLWDHQPFSSFFFFFFPSITLEKKCRTLW